MAKFDMAAAFAAAVGDVSKSDTSRENIEYIGLDKLDPDPDNFYSLTGLEELAANIELCGLQQPIRVRPAEHGRYVIVSGHRRWSALKLLHSAEEDGDRWVSVPCIVERDQASPELRELRLIMANASTRQLSPAELSRQAAKVTELLYQLKEQGYDFPGRMRDQVAAACQVSASKLARLKVIRERLTPHWTALFEAGKLAEAPAYLMARQSVERQEWLAGVYSRGVHAKYEPTENSIQGWLEGLNTIDAVVCQDGTPCVNRDGMRERLAESTAAYWHPCESCCGQCSRRMTCGHVCPSLENQVAEERAEQERKLAEARRKDEERSRERCAEEKRRQERERAAWRRLGEEAERVNLPAEALGEILGENRVEMVERALNGVVDPYCVLENDFSANLDADVVAGLAEAGVSLDYVLGLTDTQPEGDTDSNAPWHYGDPVEDGYYWCLCGPLDGSGKLLYWSGDHWEFSNIVMAINTTVVCWMHCPPIPEAQSWHRQQIED